METQIRLNVNGVEHRIEIDPWTTLSDVLREHINIYSPKKVGDHGQCGACTVLLVGV